MYCPNCGEEVDNPQNYCMKCGTKLDSDGTIESEGIEGSIDAESGTDSGEQTSSEVKTSRGKKEQKSVGARPSSRQKRSNRTSSRSSNSDTVSIGTNYNPRYNWFKYCKIVTPIATLLILASGGTVGLQAYVPGQGYNFGLALAAISPTTLLMYYVGALLALAGIVLMTLDIYEMRRKDIWDRSPWVWLVSAIFLSIFVLIYYIYIRQQYEV